MHNLWNDKRHIPLIIWYGQNQMGKETKSLKDINKINGIQDSVPESETVKHK